MLGKTLKLPDCSDLTGHRGQRFPEQRVWTRVDNGDSQPLCASNIRKKTLQFDMGIACAQPDVAAIAAVVFASADVATVSVAGCCLWLCWLQDSYFKSLTSAGCCCT